MSFQYQIWQKAVTDENGAIVPNAVVTVYNESTANLIALYSNQAGAAQTNPFTIGTDGIITFYVDSSAFTTGVWLKVVVEKDAYSQTWRYQHGGMGGAYPVAESDASSAANDLLTRAAQDERYEADLDVPAADGYTLTSTLAGARSWADKRPIPFQVDTITAAGAGTWTRPTGTNFIEVICKGGGGAGADEPEPAAGGGGGEGGTSIKYIAAPSASYPVSLGAGGATPGADGGNTYFNDASTCQAMGGKGAGMAGGGIGGTRAGSAAGDIRIAGASGHNSYVISINFGTSQWETRGGNGGGAGGAVTNAAAIANSGGGGSGTSGYETGADGIIIVKCYK